MTLVRIAFVHAVALSALFLPFRWSLVALAAGVYFFQMFGFEGICHRYFAHRAYRTSRVFQFVLAAWGGITGQKDVLWWADMHRVHHQYADTPKDPHSAVQHGIWYAHVGWLGKADYQAASSTAVQDLRAFPELVFISRYAVVSLLLLWAGLFLFGHFTTVMGPGVGGIECLVWGGFVSLALSLNATWMTNSVTHFASLAAAERGGFFRWRRFPTTDLTNNAPFLTVPMMGANWHNNHHRFPGAAQAGFYPGEIDPTFWILRCFAAVGLIWDLRRVPEALLEEGLRFRP